MTTIKQLLDAPVGYRTGGFVYQVKHTHKMTEHPVTAKNAWHWTHTVTLTDGKDEIKADIVLEKNRKFCNGNDVKVIVCEIIAESEGGYGKKLLVHEHKLITQTADEYEAEKRGIPQTPAKAIPNKWDIIGRGKVKHGLLCAFMEGQQRFPKIAELKVLAKLADWVMSKEDKYEG